MYCMNANLLAVLTAAVIQWILGWLWYGVLFKQSWKVLVDPGQNAKPANTGATLVIVFIVNLVLSFALAQVIQLTPWTTFSKGTFAGTVCGLGFVAMPLLAQHIREKRPFKLYGINALYWLLAMLLSGGLLAVWR
jgi:hypothetical protein